MGAVRADAPFMEEGGRAVVAHQEWRRRESNPGPCRPRYMLLMGVDGGFVSVRSAPPSQPSEPSSRFMSQPARGSVRLVSPEI